MTSVSIQSNVKADAPVNVTESRVSILLVDDQPKNLFALEAILEPLGLDLVKAHSGQEALKEVLRRDFAAILLDVQMPDMDGFETAQLIKRRPRSESIPIIFLTAISKEDSYVFKGYSVGAVDYLLKPFNADVLRSKVSVFIDLFRKNEQIKQQAEELRVRREHEVAEFKRVSEQRYRDLAESMPQMVWTADASGALTYRNRRWWDCAAVEYNPARTLGWEALLHPDDQATFEKQWQSAVDTASDWEAEFRFGSAITGHYRWHLVRALPVRDERKPGQPVQSWIGTSTDIDDRKNAEQALRLLAEASKVLAESLDYKTALQAVSQIAIPDLGDWCMIDLHVEDGAERGSGRWVASVTPDLPSSVIDEAAAAMGRENVLATAKRKVVPDVALSDEEPGSRNAEHLARINALGFKSYMCVPILARDRVLGTIAFMTAESRRRYRAIDVNLAEDLARRVSAAVETARLYAVAEAERAQLADANRAKDEFLAVLSHELRTPLNSMLGWTQIIRAGGLDEKTLARAMDTIERNARSQAQLIADLLDVSRIVTGKLSVEMRHVPMVAVVEQAVDAVRPAATAKGVKLEVELLARDMTVNGDPDRLQQVVSNLLSNAIKFTPSGGIVNVSLFREANNARLDVRDSGQGIAPEFLPQVFERFKQGEGATTRAHGGLGLGLAIVRHLVDVHRGTVKASSPGLEQGATFSVSLPLLVALEKGSSRPPPSAGIAPLEGDALRGVNVLVVEDDDDGRELLEMVLLDYGATVTAVSNAEDAMERLREGGLDILVSDIGLPLEDGYSLLRRVRAFTGEESGRIPAIALTAYASGDDRARALAAGFEAHVTKPVEPQELAAAVAALVGRCGERETNQEMRSPSAADLSP